jgi:hypothetical protein
LPGLKNGSFGANTASADSKSKGFWLKLDLAMSCYFVL